MSVVYYVVHFISFNIKAIYCDRTENFLESFLLLQQQSVWMMECAAHTC